MEHENKYDLKNFQGIENRIKEIIRTKQFSHREKETIKARRKDYPGLTNIQIITIFYIQHTSSLFYMREFYGKTKEEAKNFIEACRKWDMTSGNTDIPWKKRKQIANALLAGMETFEGKTEEEADKYLDRYYELINNGKLHSSTEELKRYAYSHDSALQNHLQNSVCINCHTIERNCYKCPHFITQYLKAK